MSRSSVAWRPWSAASNAAAVLARAGDAPFLLALRDAFRVAFAALLLALVVFVFAVGGSGSGGAAIAERVSRALLPAFGVMAIALAIVLPYDVARRTGAAPLPLVAASLLAFVIVVPRPLGRDAIAYLHAIGPTGIFLAILAAGIVSAGVALARGIAGAAAAVALLAIAVFAGHLDLSAAVASMLAPMARLGDSLPALVAIVAAQMLLWLVGVHGSAMLSAVLTPIYLTLQMQNTAAYAQHAPLPHLVVSSLFLFVFPGGSGATLALAILMMRSRTERLRRLGRIAILPSLTNVNEPLLFGLPVVLNPFFAVPFFLAPLVLAVLTYAAIALGFVARPAFYVPVVVPAPIATYLATLDWRAPLLVVVNVVVAGLIYWPFLRAYERQASA